MVNEYVEAKDLKAQAALDILWFGRPVCVGQLLVTSDAGLNCEFFDLLPALGARNHLRIVLCCLVDMLENLSETALVA